VSFNRIEELGEWKPETDVDNVVFTILRRFIHMSPSLFMDRVRDIMLADIDKIKQDAYKQGFLDARKLLEDNQP